MTDTRKLAPHEAPTVRQVMALPYEQRRTPRAPKGPATIAFDATAMLNMTATQIRDLLTGAEK